MSAALVKAASRLTERSTRRCRPADRRAHRATTAAEINAAFAERAATGALAGIVAYSEEPIVSADIVKSSYSAIFDAPLTTVVDCTQIKVIAWYDDEWATRTGSWNWQSESRSPRRSQRLRDPAMRKRSCSGDAKTSMPSLNPPDQTFGASLAGAKAAEMLRVEGFDGRLVMIGADAERPCKRPPLSKRLIRARVVVDDWWLTDADISLDDDAAVAEAGTA